MVDSVGVYSHYFVYTSKRAGKVNPINGTFFGFSAEGL
jgi:hypothetical protein